MNFWNKRIDNNGIKGDGKKPPRLMPGLANKDMEKKIWTNL